MKTFLSLLTLAILSTVSHAGNILKWWIAPDGVSWQVQDTDTVTVSVTVHPSTPAGTYVLWGHATLVSVTGATKNYGNIVVTNTTGTNATVTSAPSIAISWSGVPTYPGSFPSGWSGAIYPGGPEVSGDYTVYLDSVKLAGVAVTATAPSGNYVDVMKGQFHSTYTPPAVSNKTGTWAIRIGPPDDGAAEYQAQLHNTSTSAHTVALKINGTTVATTTVPAATETGLGGTPAAKMAELNFTDASANNGDTYVWVVDGVEGGGGVIAGLGDGVSSITIPTLQASWDYAAPPPDTSGVGTGEGNTPPPIVNPGGTGAPGTPGAPGSPAQSVVNNPNVTLGGAGTATNQDIYNDVYRALIDAGNATAGPAITTGDLTDYVQDDKGKTEDVEDAMNVAFDGIETAKDSFTAKITALNLSSLPTSLGTVSTINFGTLHLGASTGSLNVNLTTGPLGNFASLIRTVFLFGLTIGWIVLCLSTVRGYL